MMVEMNDLWKLENETNKKFKYIMKILGIKICKHCGGDGELRRMQGSVKFGCPTCNGYGYTCDNDSGMDSGVPPMKLY